MKRLLLLLVVMSFVGCVKYAPVHLPEVQLIKEQMAEDEKLMKEYYSRIKNANKKIQKIYQTEINVYNQLLDDAQKRRIEELNKKVIIELKERGEYVSESWK